MQKEKLLYYVPAMEQVAKRMAANDPSIILGQRQWEFFPDEWPNFSLSDKEDEVQGRHTIFLAAMEKPEDVFPQLAFAYAIPRFGALSFRMFLNHFPTGQNERLDPDKHGKPQQKIVTAKSLARMLSAIPLSALGPARITMYDIHALPEQMYFGDCVLPEPRSAMPLVPSVFKPHANTAVVFPDEGADKRFDDMFSDYYRIYCSKVRTEDDDRLIRIEKGIPRHRHCLLIDDVKQSGKTALRTIEKLREHGAKKISVFMTHIVSPGEAWKQFLDIGLENFFFTDSRPTIAAQLDGVGPFKCVSLDTSMNQVIAEDRLYNI